MKGSDVSRNDVEFEVLDILTTYTLMMVIISILLFQPYILYFDSTFRNFNRLALESVVASLLLAFIDVNKGDVLALPVLSSSSPSSSSKKSLSGNARADGSGAL